jgi:hypothetical protein
VNVEYGMENLELLVTDVEIHMSRWEANEQNTMNCRKYVEEGKKKSKSQPVGR